MILPINKSMYAMIGGFIVILIISLVFLAIWYSKTRQELIQLNTIDQYRQAAKSVGDMRQAALHRSVLLHEMTLSEDIFDRDDKFQEFREEAGHFMLAKENFLSLKQLKTDRELWSAIAEKVNHNSQGQRYVAQLILDGEINQARQLLYETYMPGQRSIMLLLSQLLDQQNQMVATELKMADKDKARSDYIISALAFFAILITMGIIFLVLRITIRIQNDLRKADQVLIANKMKSDFLSSMSHELRTPLNAILGFGQLLEAQSKDENISNEIVQRYSSNILKGGYHLLGLINEVLELSRIEGGYLKIEFETVQLTKIITECIEQIKVALANKQNITLINKIDDPSLNVLSDPQRLIQIIINLLSNAVKYNREGGTVTVESELIGEDRLRILITDTGVGIAAHEIDKLFDPFERLTFKHGQIEGSGIGLTITKRLVEAMGCNIGVESTINKGSSFWVELPLESHINQSMEAESTELLESHSPKIKQKNKHRILYIEDNPMNVQLMEDIINNKWGFELLTSETAEDGLTIAEEKIPDLILMDINLPGIDGITAFKILRSVEATRNIPVIAVSGAAMDSDIKAGQEAGFDDYITKPFDLDRLYAVIEKYISD